MRRRSQRSSDIHSDWLTQVDVDGPFLAYPVIKDMWPSGVDRLGDTDERLDRFKQAFVQWQRALDHYTAQPKSAESRHTYDAVRHAWIDVVLDDLAEWMDLRTDSDVSVRSPGEQITVAATGGLKGRDGEIAALVLVCDPTSGLREAGLDGWAANDVDRLAMLLRKSQVEVGIVTDGQWWGLVWAKDGKPTGSGVVNASTWAEEPLVRDAFVTLINQRRFRAVDHEQRLSRLFERSELEAEEITEALGTQVRRSVELLVQAFSEARLKAAKVNEPDPLAEKSDDVYQAAVTVMMRIVFLLFAEERDMLPTERLYWNSYAIKGLLDELRAQAAGGEELLDESFDSWHRLLAVSRALHGGVNYDEMRMPAYGGSLLDSERFPWLHATDQHGRLQLEVSDRVMLHVLESVQTVVAKGERRRISFREIDVEQIGYIYEGLLGYSCTTASDDIVIGLVGKDGEEPEIAATALERLYDEADDDAKTFAEVLRAWVNEEQPAATSWSASKLAKLYDAEVDEPEMRRLLTPVADGDEEMLKFLIEWSNFIRRDLRGIPLVIPIGGLVVVETPSRKTAGAHYTPRSLAEEVVIHALQPLVYEPGPLQTDDEDEWHLKPAAAILDLKVADIAAGSGAFLVAAARYLSDRLVEAWITEGLVGDAVPSSAEVLRRRAIREVIARCLYGADINPMAVEMCKLSLWLVSMDKTRPFSFVDDKIFCGNSLLGLTSLDQLRYLHIDPKPTSMQQQLLVDIDAKIDAATQLRHELASPVDERDPMRSSRAKAELLEQFHQATAELRLISDGVVAAGLPLGGKPGRPLNDEFKSLSWQLQEALPPDGATGDQTALLERIDLGLTPTVDTDYERWVPLHWVVEAPDVLVERGGFDAIVGNPPFLVAKDISGAFGSPIREWLTNAIAHSKRGKADLAAFFLVRASSLTRGSGELGLLLPKSVSEGDTRAVGLDQLLGEWRVHRTVRSTRWPSVRVTVWIAKVWLTRIRPSARVVCDGEPVAMISSSLEAAGGVVGQPITLTPSVAAFKGSVLQGDGFTMSSDVAERMVEVGKNAEVVRPYLNGSTVYSDPTNWDNTWVVDFRELPSASAQKYAEPWAWVDSQVRPEREQIDRDKYPRMVEQWWKHWNTRVEMYDKIRQRPTTWVLSAVSRHAAPVLVPTDAVLSSALVVFDSSAPWLGGLLSSSVHKAWVSRWGSTMQSDIRYAPSDLWVTFPLPVDVSRLDRSSSELMDAREAISSGRGIGVTPALNLVDDPSNSEPDIERYRSALRQVDLELFELYGWEHEGPEHDFVAYRNVTRYWLTSVCRLNVLDLLLAENHRRARAEGQTVPDQNPSDGQDTLFS